MCRPPVLTQWQTRPARSDPTPSSVVCLHKIHNKNWTLLINVNVNINIYVNINV